MATAAQKVHTAKSVNNEGARKMIGLRATPGEIEKLDAAAGLDNRHRQGFVLHYSILIAERILAGKPIEFATK